MSSGKGGFFASKQWKNIMKYVYGLGASIVIVGALFKIMHWPGSGILLTVGLLTEAGIFALSVLEPIHEDPHWELVYPELAMAEDSNESGQSRVSRGKITDELDKMLEEAKIDKALLERLGDGMRTLGDNAAQLKGVSSAAAATDGYVTSLQAASEKVSALSDAYERASISIAGLTSNTAEGESFGEQMQKVSKNLAALNNVYELQLKGSTSHLEASEKFHAQVIEMMANLSASAEDTRLYKENMALLSQNLTDLNNVYGNMLRAMRA